MRPASEMPASETNVAGTGAPETLAEAELRKLRKINQVLMDRVERDMDAQGGNAFSLFQTAITLEGRVSERTAELTRLTQRLMHEIAERREAEAALSLAKAEAEQANLGKTRFLAAASHDLHQPLSAARLFAGALGDEVGEGRPRELVQRLEAALDTVSELLDTLLDISKLDAGAWKTQPGSFPVAPLLARLADEYGPQAEACGIELRTVRSGAVVHTDRPLFERVLRNLISNAIRYTASGRVLVGCRRRAGAIRVEVWDTGIGIPEGELARLFEEFRQLGNNPRRGDKGVGLGLAIVDRIARLLDVRIEVRSRLGHGSCFAATVPLGTMLGPAAQEAWPEPARQAGLAGRLVAVVDNDEQVREAVTALLGTWGCHPVAAASTRALLAALEGAATRPDLVVADYMLDGGHFGTETIAALRERYGNIPALIISSDKSAALKARALALGCAFLGKPASPAKLRSMLSYLLSRPAEDAAPAP